MSWRVVVAVLDANIRPPSRKLVAVVFAESARDDGTRAFPGAVRLGVRTGMASPTIREHVRELIEIDHVLIEVRRAQTNQRRELRFDMGRLAELTGADVPAADGADVPAAVTSGDAPTGADVPANRRSRTSEQALAGERPSVLPRPTSSITADTSRRVAPLRAVAESADPFEEFWDAFGLKIGKPKARRAWADVLAAGADAAEIIEGARRYRAWRDGHPSPPHEKYAQGWLHDERWADELPPYPRQRGAVDNARRLAERALDRGRSEHARE